jgi:RNA polymerase sigma factor (sigma-70 family)
LAGKEQAARFEAQILVHLDAAYSLARWIMRDTAAASDAVQDGCLRAFRAFDQMQGPNPRAWFLAVIRNACMDLLRKQRERAIEDEYDDDLHGGAGPQAAGGAITPEDIAARA